MTSRRLSPSRNSLDKSRSIDTAKSDQSLTYLSSSSPTHVVIFLINIVASGPRFTKMPNGLTMYTAEASRLTADQVNCLISSSLCSVCVLHVAMYWEMGMEREKEKELTMRIDNDLADDKIYCNDTQWTCLHQLPHQASSRRSSSRSVATRHVPVLSWNRTFWWRHSERYTWWWLERSRRWSRRMSTLLDRRLYSTSTTPWVTRGRTVSKFSGDSTWWGSYSRPVDRRSDMYVCRSYPYNNRASSRRYEVFRIFLHTSSFWQRQQWDASVFGRPSNDGYLIYIQQ